MAPVAPRRVFSALLLFPVASSAMKVSGLRLRSDDDARTQANLTTGPEQKPPASFTAANESVRLMRGLQGRFKDVTLVLLGVTPESLNLLEVGYQPFFGDMAFVMWLKDKEEPMSLLRSRSYEEEDEFGANLDDEVSAQQADPYLSTRFASPKLHNGHAVFNCPKAYRLDYQSWCLAEILQYVSQKHSNARGVFVSDAAFWFDPVEIARGDPGLRLSDFWQLGPGLKVGRFGKMGPKCYGTFAEIQKDTEWPFGQHNQDPIWNSANLAHKGMGYKRAMVGLERKADTGEEEVEQKPVGKPEACIGWADAYYLPRGSFELIRTMLPHFKGVMREAAIPTVINYCKKFERFRGYVEKRCWGGCCFPPAMDPSVFRKNICGHRMALKQLNIREGWVNFMWNATKKLVQDL
eukprot:CAMPEP_0171099894 /NCGR_PEP_ID=MMETSP0766_2-20121228/52635_1 /TAXON_ID=439317 /ORGANISM="Gambierdiscus australes, Strain CAWD 149" /LENGTH=406 /DNA_ID=CAMNT_0011559625 /DNA_START=79 /DNA_END=1299 /DNA_ORIENTATION=+